MVHRYGFEAMDRGGPSRAVPGICRSPSRPSPDLIVSVQLRSASATMDVQTQIAYRNSTRCSLCAGRHTVGTHGGQRGVSPRQ